MSYNNILAIDPGERHYGFALYSNDLLHELGSKSFRDIYMLIGYIRELIRQYAVDVVILGDGGDSSKSYISKIITELEKVNVAVVLFDEYLSSFQGANKEVGEGSIKGEDHAAAAVEILREYIEDDKNKIAG